MLIPMFLIIGIWGGSNRIYATVKFFLYTVLGSLLMLIAFLYLYFKSGTFSIIDYYYLPISLEIQIFIFLAFFMAFAVKIIQLVHSWHWHGRRVQNHVHFFRQWVQMGLLKLAKVPGKINPANIGTKGFNSPQQFKTEKALSMAVLPVQLRDWGVSFLPRGDKWGRGTTCGAPGSDWFW